MSPDLIKAAEFRALYANEEPGSTEIDRFSSHEKRVRELERELVEAKERARAEAAKARAEGRQEAADLARAELHASTQALHAAAAELRGWTSKQVEISADEIARVAVAVAGKIVRREIAHDDEFVVRLIRRCLHKIVHRQIVEIRVSPGEYDRVAAALDELGGGADPGHEITVRKDRRVAPGGCVVETPDFVVDGTPRSQLTRAREALTGDRS